ncbi:STAS domain-containing protein [Mycobacterium sp.]|uniref:STAS domain-containing protein n=1 Tax=Mycobacterium sp. TaxID=1785 RepID=UPI003D0FE729
MAAAYSPADRDDVAIDRGCGPAHVRAHYSPLETVLTISGDIDASNIEQIKALVGQELVVENSLRLDLSGVNFMAAGGPLILIAVEEALRGIPLPWTMVTSPSVNRALRLGGW